MIDGQRPPYVHLASTRRHSHDRCSQAFPVFRALPLPCIVNENRRTKNGRGLGTRLTDQHDMHVSTLDGVPVGEFNILIILLKSSYIQEAIIRLFRLEY